MSKKEKNSWKWLLDIVRVNFATILKLENVQDSSFFAEGQIFPKKLFFVKLWVNLCVTIIQFFSRQSCKYLLNILNNIVSLKYVLIISHWYPPLKQTPKNYCHTFNNKVTVQPKGDLSPKIFLAYCSAKCTTNEFLFAN